MSGRTPGNGALSARRNDPNGWVRNVRPFTLPVSEYFHTPAPFALTSTQYATEFNEVKALGALNRLRGRQLSLAGELVGPAPGSHAVRGHAPGGGIEGTDNH